MNWKKVATGVTTTALAAAMLAGCGGAKPAPATNASAPAAPKQPVTLQFWAHWGSEQRKPTIEKIMKTWNDAHPDIQVQYTFVPFDQIITKTMASVAAGNPPDDVVIDLFTSQQRAAKKQATDLSQFGADSLKDQYYPQLWASGTYQGKQYALPFVTDTRLLFYNKDAFKEVGLDPNNPPKTWDDLWNYADKLDKKNGNQLARVGFNPMFGGGFDLFAGNNGGGFWDAQGNPTFNSDKNVQALQWIKKWSDRYGAQAWAAFSSSFQGGANDPFITGKVAMKVDVATYGVTLQKYAANMNYGMVAIPTPNGQPNPTSSWGGGFNVEVPYGSKHAKEAYEFAKWFTSDGAKIWAAEQNDMPANKAAGASIDNPMFKAMVANMPYTTVQLRPLNAPDYGSALNPAVDNVTLKGADPKAELDKVQDQVQKMIKDNTGK